MKIFSFNGRSHRLAFFGINLASTAALFLPIILLVAVAGVADPSALSSSDPGGSPLGIAIVIVFCVLLIPTVWVSLAVSVRRLHDLGWSGFWYLLQFVPIASLVQSVMMLFVPSQQGENRFGPSPVEPPEAVAQTFA